MVDNWANTIMNKENLKKSLIKNFKKLIMILPEKFSNEFLLLNE